MGKKKKKEQKRSKKKKEQKQRAKTTSKKKQMISTKEYTSMHACAAALRTETEKLHTERKTTQTTDENVRTKKKIKKNLHSK